MLQYDQRSDGSKHVPQRNPSPVHEAIQIAPFVRDKGIVEGYPVSSIHFWDLHSRKTNLSSKISRFQKVCMKSIVGISCQISLDALIIQLLGVPSGQKETIGNRRSLLQLMGD